MARPKLRDAQLRERILHSALELLEAEGVGAVTTRAVARRAGTSAPAIYELFGDKTGLVRALFFEGFRQLGDAYGAIALTDDPVGDLHATANAFRRFALERPKLFLIMFSQPFASFEPTPAERRLGETTRHFVTARIRRAIDSGDLGGDAGDLEHTFVGLALGLATQETGGWLGSSRSACDRRWRKGFDALLVTRR